MINAFIIHCDEQINRYNRVKNIQLTMDKNINLEIFKGIYAVNVTKPEINIFMKSHDENINSNHNFSKPGEIGCFLSHHLILKQICEKYDEYSNYILIFEDDVEILNNNEFYNQIQNIIKNSDNIFDIIYLCQIPTKEKKKINKGKNYKDNIYEKEKNKFLNGTSALLIKKSSVKKIYELNCNKQDPIDGLYRSFDDENKIKIGIIYPMICNFGNRNDTIIQNNPFKN